SACGVDHVGGVLRRARARGRAPQRRPESETARREDAAAQSVTGIERRHRTDGGLFDAEKAVVGRLEAAKGTLAADREAAPVRGSGPTRPRWGSLPVLSPRACQRERARASSPFHHTGGSDAGIASR